jgi:hypothetical protein
MEMARAAEMESLTFIKGEADFFNCDKCPITCFTSACAIKVCCKFNGKDVFEKRAVAQAACYGAFMRFLFSED